MPQFTVLIPLYNKAPYIEGAIRSVLNQTVSPLEILVIDDGSTDGGAELVERMNIPTLRFIRQENAGVSVARNKGIELAKGDWVAFLDADDYYHPHMLGALASLSLQFPEAGAVSTRYRTSHDVDGLPTRWNAGPSVDAELITDLRRRWLQRKLFCTSSIAIRRRTLDAMQPCFSAGETVGEDLEFWFRLSDRTKVAILYSDHATVRVGVPNSLSRHVVIHSLPPYVERMRAHALSGQIPKQNRASALWYVDQQGISIARDLLISGQRKRALAWLLCTRARALDRRWLTTFLMLLAPSGLAARWQSWRVHRTVS